MSELISASDKLSQIKEREELEKQQELERFQKLLDDPIIERVKRTLIERIADTNSFPVYLVLKDELYAIETLVTEMIESELGSWLDSKGYQVRTRKGRGEAANFMILIVQPK